MMFSGRSRWSIPGHHIHKNMNPDLAQIMKNDSPDTGDNADADKVQGPHAGPRYSGGEIMTQNFSEMKFDSFQR